MRTLTCIVGFITLASLCAQAQWTTQASNFPNVNRGVFDIDVVDANVVWAAAYDGTGGNAPVQDFTRTTDGGNTWTGGTIAAAAGKSFSNISALDGSTAWVSMYDPAAAGGWIYKTTDGGLTWTQQNSTGFTSGTSFANVVHFWDANNGWCMGDPAGGYFEIYTSSDGGANWTRVPQANIPAPLAGEFGYTNVFSVIGNTIWYGTNRGRVYKSTDGGLNWTVATTGLTDINDIVMRDALNGLVSQVSTASLYKTTDGGTTWSVVPFIGSYHTGDLEVIPGTATYLTTGAAAGNEGSSMSFDDGTTWTEIDTAAIQRLALGFYDNTTGWCGGFNDQPSNGMFKYSGIVGIEHSETENKFSMNMYPNPFSATATLVILSEAKNLTFVMYDLLGREMKQIEIDRNKVEIKRENLPAGMYLYLLKSEKGILASGKVIIQ